jgi:hypothetical protein
MTTVGFFVLAGLFAMKILWNLAVPYFLATSAFRSPENRGKGISLMPAVEVIFLGGAVVLSYFRGSAWPWNAAGVALIGAAMIIGSYAHMVVAGGLAGWIAEKHRDRH